MQERAPRAEQRRLDLSLRTEPDLAMDAFFEGLIHRAATLDELLSSDFEILPGQKSDVERAALRLAEWCRSSASGDWLLFNRRLERDGLSFVRALPRLATMRRRVSASTPQWI